MLYLKQFTHKFGLDYQKSIVTHKTVSDDTHIYGKCNVEATLIAAKELSDRAFKLYIRMNLHQDNHTYALSPVAIQHDNVADYVSLPKSQKFMGHSLTEA